MLASAPDTYSVRFVNITPMPLNASLNLGPSRSPTYRLCGRRPQSPGAALLYFVKSRAPMSRKAMSAGKTNSKQPFFASGRTGSSRFK